MFEKMATKRLHGSGSEKSLSLEEQQAKINEIRQLLGPIASKFPVLCSDASISRYLRARNWNTKKATKMLKEALKWRLEYKPEKIRWDDVADEAKTGKVYIANYLDKRGRTVLVMRPGFENTSSTVGQMKYLVYCMEKAIMNLNPDQEQMVWLIDFQGWNMACISVKATRETAHVLQDLYPERLALGILYNPPKIFESFWLVVKPFLETKTYKKVKFVFSDNPQSLKLMDELFEVDKLEPTFGGKSSIGFNYETYANRMRDEDSKMTEPFTTGCPSPCIPAIISELQQSERNSEVASSSDDENALEVVEGKIEDHPVGSKEVENAERDGIKEVNLGKD